MNFMIILVKTNKTKTKVPDILLYKQLLHIHAMVAQQRPPVTGLVGDMFLPLRDREVIWWSNLRPNWSVSAMRSWKILHPTDYCLPCGTSITTVWKTEEKPSWKQEIIKIIEHLGWVCYRLGVKGWSYCQTRCEEHLNDGRMGSWTQVGNIRVVTWCVSTGSIGARGGTVAIMSNTNRVHIMWLIRWSEHCNLPQCLLVTASSCVFTWFFIFSVVFPSLLSLWPLKWIPKWGRPLSAVSSWSPWQQDGTPLMRLPAGSWTSPSVTWASGAWGTERTSLIKSTAGFSSPGDSSRVREKLLWNYPANTGGPRWIKHRI